MVKTYVAQNDFVAFQVEDAPAAGAWTAQTQYAGYTGQSYYRWTGSNQFGNPGQGILKYQVKLDEASTYYLAIRALRVTENRNPTSDADNDIWIRIDGKPWEKMLHGTKFGDWGWMRSLEAGHESIEQSKFFLGAGVHTIEISGRSQHVMIDKVHLNKGGFDTRVNAPLSPTTDGPVVQPPTNPDPTPAPPPTDPDPTPPSNPDPAPADDAFSVFLVDVATDQRIAEITDGSVIDGALIAGREVGIVADTGVAGVGSVFLNLDNGAELRTDNSGPFSLTRDRGTDVIEGVDLGGSHSLKLTAFAQDNAAGARLATVDIDFSVSGSTGGGSTGGGSTGGGSTGGGSTGGGTTKVTVVAGGTAPADGDISFTLEVDGVTVGSRTIADPAASNATWNPNTDYERFDFFVNDADVDKVVVSFDSDGPGRDLYVSGVEVAGESYSSTEAEFFRDGGGSQGPRIWLPVEGDLVFDIV